MTKRRSLTRVGGNGKNPSKTLGNNLLSFKIRFPKRRLALPNKCEEFNSDKEEKLQLTGASLTTTEAQKPTIVTGVTVGGFYKSTDNKVEELESISNETNLPKTPAPVA